MCIAESLRTNPTLTSLNLESNSISSVGLEAIADALRTNTVLTELKVANQRSPFSQASEEKLAACLEGNHTLVRLTADLRGSRARDPNPNPSPSPNPNPSPSP